MCISMQFFKKVISEKNADYYAISPINKNTHSLSDTSFNPHVKNSKSYGLVTHMQEKQTSFAFHSQKHYFAFDRFPK